MGQKLRTWGAAENKDSAGYRTVDFSSTSILSLSSLKSITVEFPIWRKIRGWYQAISFVVSLFSFPYLQIDKLLPPLEESSSTLSPLFCQKKYALIHISMQFFFCFKLLKLCSNMYFVAFHTV